MFFSISWFEAYTGSEVISSVKTVLFLVMNSSHLEIWHFVIKLGFVTNAIIFILCLYLSARLLNFRLITFLFFLKLRERKINKTRKAPGALAPPLFPLPLLCKVQYGHSRYEPKWCKFLKLVIYFTIDVCAAIQPPTPYPRLLCTLLLVITWIPNSMNTFPIPHSLVIHLFWHSRRRTRRNSFDHSVTQLRHIFF